MNGADFTYDEMITRNIGVLTRDEQKKISETKLCIIGLGGQGAAAIIAAQLGFKKIIGVDKDIYEVVNLNRQLLATTETVGMDKAKAGRQMIAKYNPHTELDFRTLHVQEAEARELFAEADYVISAVDDPWSRVVISRVAEEMGKTYTIGGPLGWKFFLSTFRPGGPSYEELTHQPTLGRQLDKVRDKPLLENHQKCFWCCTSGFIPEFVEKSFAGDIQFYPMFFTSNYCCIMIVNEILKMIIGRGKVAYAPKRFTMDLSCCRPWNIEEIGMRAMGLCDILNTQGQDAATEKLKSILYT